LILDGDKLVGSEGGEGELCVRGSSLAYGYFNNPEKTGLVFVQNPLNKSYPELIYRTGDIVFKNQYGELVFKGRKDTLIKHYGYRIELGEIEHVAVNKLNVVKNCCVVYSHKLKEIVMFCELAADINEVEVRKKLSLDLPKYMIPTKYIWLDELPRNANGKIDRNKLNEIANAA
jgi:acyl-coenzyme A synthetase/AMP-(fatty) acid ligase